MATPQFTSDEPRPLHDLAEQWAKIVSRRAFGAESILQLWAALLSEDGRLERYFARRPGCTFRNRPHPVSPEMQTAN